MAVLDVSFEVWMLELNVRIVSGLRAKIANLGGHLEHKRSESGALLESRIAELKGSWKEGILAAEGTLKLIQWEMIVEHLKTQNGQAGRAFEYESPSLVGLVGPLTKRMPESWRMSEVELGRKSQTRREGGPSEYWVLELGGPENAEYHSLDGRLLVLAFFVCLFLCFVLFLLTGPRYWKCLVN